MPDIEPEDKADDSAEQETPPPMNRAERRRAQGKSGGQHDTGGGRQGPVGGRSAPAATQRNWASRRSG